jgi:hypothetical protein
MESLLLSLLGILTLILITFSLTWFFQQRVQKEKVRKALLDLNKSLDALWGVEAKILGSLNFEEVVDKIANIVLTELNYLQLGYVVVVLALIDKEKDVLRRISLSSTPEAQIFLKEFKVRFRDITISLDQTENLGIKAIKEKRRLCSYTKRESCGHDFREIFNQNKNFIRGWNDRPRRNRYIHKLTRYPAWSWGDNF